MKPSEAWRLKTRALLLTPRTFFMGILNVTPDSFSDGGLWAEPQAAIEHGLQMLEQGADVVDVGGESTRPGASPLTPVEEQSRILPVIRGILRHRPEAILSVDTYNAETARAALDEGIEIVNDVSGGLWDEGMRGLWAATGCGVVLMHTRGRPYEWRRQPKLPLDQVVPLVLRELRERVDEALTAGVAHEAMVLDPGFGFGKILEENFPLIAGISDIAALGFPVAAGVSRKGFLKRALEEIDPEQAVANTQVAGALRDATIAANTAAILAGARVLRLHDVTTGRRAAAVADHIVAACRAGKRDFTIGGPGA